MKMQDDPRMIDARVGGGWLTAGFRLFHQHPLGWTMILFMYWAAMLMLAFIPLFGMVLPLLLAPGLSLGFLEIAKAVDEKRPPSPPLLISGFRSTQAKGLFTLGSFYLLEILTIMLVTYVLDGGLLLQWITAGVLPEESQMDRVRMTALIGLLLYVPVMMSFWFAPQLVMWRNFAPLKALFYSFFAVWRNRGAFFRYLLTWIGLVVFVAAAALLLNQSLEISTNAMSAFLFPVTLIIMAVAHGSFYQSTKDVFGEIQQENSNNTPLP
jgi:hypothetical protein